MDNIIKFDETITSYNFYNRTLKLFYAVYRKYNISIKPVLDFEDTDYIEPSAVPVLLCFVDYLKRLYKLPLEVRYVAGGNLQNFFIQSRFYDITKDLNLIEWGDIYLGWNNRQIRDEHKISYTYTKYKDAEKIEDPIQKRDFIYDCLYDDSKIVYETIMGDTNKLPLSIIENSIMAIAEIKTNAIMYSRSRSYTYVASDAYGTRISIADSGIGFENSFDEAGRAMEMLDKFSNERDKRLHNYYIIMSVLNYSFKKHFNENRTDLWTLKENVVNNNGVFKIQHANTQVIFSHARCMNCRKLDHTVDLSPCVECLLENYRDDVWSPIKIYGIGFPGVRIEVSINRE